MISIVEFLSFAVQVPTDDYKILISNDCIDKMIQNALDKNHIFDEKKFVLNILLSSSEKELTWLTEFRKAEMPKAEPIIHSLT